MPLAYEREVLQERFTRFMDNVWEEWNPNPWPPKHVEGRPTRVFVTDASDDKFSILELIDGDVERNAGEPVNPSGRFENLGADEALLTNAQDMIRDRIYYKELYGLVLVARRLEKEGVRDINVTLVGDNRSVIGAGNKGVGPYEAWWMIDEITHLFEKNLWGYENKWVESDGNAAHSATHDEPLEEYRIQRSWVVAMSAEYPPPLPEGNPNKRKSKK